MIARLWTARTAAANVSVYRTHIEQRVLPSLRSVAGYAGSTLLSHADSDDVEIVVVTWWTSLEAIRAFAGADVERAVVADEVRSLFERWDDRVRHYDVILADEP
ncbi:MAG: antibiotic biosynthesis monooxygenase family protein [Vicinamibacterales bacterium]